MRQRTWQAARRGASSVRGERHRDGEGVLMLERGGGSCPPACCHERGGGEMDGDLGRCRRRYLQAPPRRRRTKGEAGEALGGRARAAQPSATRRRPRAAARVSRYGEAEARREGKGRRRSVDWGGTGSGVGCEFWAAC